MTFRAPTKGERDVARVILWIAAAIVLYFKLTTGGNYGWEPYG
jgi:hypothetical protein